MPSLPEKTHLLKSLFKGREDVFAIRWEKGKQAGYMPAYYFDPYHFRTYKMNGGTFKDYPHKSLLPLTEKEIEKHLKGKDQIGIYPLLKDNTSWFLAADFDGKKWQKEAVLFLTACKEKDIPAYLERSRSGNGGHVWIFFEKPYPALKSRKIFLSILEQSGAFSKFDKASSFDRLFPNQDFLSGKGFGNLIALPFYKPTFEQENSCFIDPDNFEAFPDQWHFLRNIKKVPTQVLDRLYNSYSENKDAPISNAKPKKLTIYLDQNIHISRVGMHRLLINYLKQELNFANAEFFAKKKSERNTYKSKRYFKLIEENENEVILPRGFIGKLLRFCNRQGWEYDFQDRRKLRKPIDFSFTPKLRSHQQKSIEAAAKKDFGVIVSPSGSGKTIMGLKIIADKKQPALIVVHRRFLLDQWQERIQAFLSIPKQEIGIIGKGRAKIGKQITVATIQSLPKQLDKLQDTFGLILVDECHHIPAKSYRTTLNKLPSYYLYGLTATPFRKYNDDKMIFAFLGKVICEIKNKDIEYYKRPKITIRNTNFEIPFNSKTDDFETLSKILIHDSERNKLILKDVRNELLQRKRVVIITERKEHLYALSLFLKHFYEVVVLSGDDSESYKKSKWQTLRAGKFQVLLTTGQYFGEGSDLSNISTLFLVYPFSFKGKLIQYIGRIQRSEISPTIYDYRDIKIDYLNKLFLKRNTYYRKIIKQANLFDEPPELPDEPETKNIIIEKKIRILIENLDFRYGTIGFEYFDKKSEQRLNFEIENEEIRPEFEVLKPYFVKVLKSKSVFIEIYAEIQEGVILSQIATSKALENINQEIVESVKFQFLNQDFIGQTSFTGKNLLTPDELPDNQHLYSDTESILDDLLEEKNYKHARQIRYLAERHKRKLMRLRFVLEPFSFVFLLEGPQNYHLVLETLDTEEATYVWHLEKNIHDLPHNIQQIDKELNLIREKGRQAYLQANLLKFSKILHNYSCNNKGFIKWKGSLEERLV